MLGRVTLALVDEEEGRRPSMDEGKLDAGEASAEPEQICRSVAGVSTKLTSCQLR